MTFVETMESYQTAICSSQRKKLLTLAAILNI